MLCLGTGMVLLDLSIVNVAIPSIITGLRAGLDQLIWVLNGYALAFAVLLISASRFGDRFGPRRAFAGGIGLFTLASAACGAAQDPGQLIAARVAQGAGGALLTPQALPIVAMVFPADRRGMAFAVWSAVGAVASVVGPLAGGLILSGMSWRWIFLVNVPIGIAVLALTSRLVPDLRPARSHRLEPLGILLATAALFCLSFGLIEGERYRWGAIAGPISIPAALAAAAVLLGLFIAWDRTRPQPLVMSGLLRLRNFGLMNWVSLALYFGMTGLLLPMTIYLQSVLGYSPVVTGLTFAWPAAVSILFGIATARLADRDAGKYVLAAGLALFASGVAYLVWQADVGAAWPTLLPGLVVTGAGLGCTFAPLPAIAMREVSPQLAGAASGVLNTIRQVGSLVGSAVIGAVLQSRLAAADGGFSRGFVGAMRAALLIVAVVVALAAVSCIAIQRRHSRSAEEMTQPAV